MQILQLLKSSKDAWTRVVRKVANDVVYRIFNHFKNEDICAEERLTKKLFLTCFQKGKSTPRKMKGVTNWGETHVGREILIKNKNEETEKVLTSHLFNQPIPVDLRDNQYFCMTEDFEIELVSKELNHLANILHAYAGGLNFMQYLLLSFFKKKMESLQKKQKSTNLQL